MRKCGAETPVFSISSGDVRILRVQELVDNPPALFVVRPGFLDTLTAMVCPGVVDSWNGNGPIDANDKCTC